MCFDSGLILDLDVCNDVASVVMSTFPHHKRPESRLWGLWVNEFMDLTTSQVLVHWACVPTKCFMTGCSTFWGTSPFAMRSLSCEFQAVVLWLAM